MRLKLPLFGAAIFAVLCGAVFFTGAPATAYTYWDIQTGPHALPNGVQSAVNWDTQCRNYLNASYRGAYFDSTGNGALRTGINLGASYVPDTWLSARGSGNTVTPISVNSTDSSVPLQINDAVFLCGPLVNPDLAGLPWGQCRTNVSGDNIIYRIPPGSRNGPQFSSRWVTSAGNPNDIRPNGQSSGCMYPSRTFQYTKIASLSVVKDNNSFYGGTVSPGAVGQAIYLGRDDGSRYWYGDKQIPVTFTPAGGRFNMNGTIHIRMGFRKFSGYHNINYQLADKACEAGRYVGAPPTYDALVSQCDIQYSDLFVNIRLKQNYTLVPNLTVAPPVLTQDNTNVSIAASVKNTGTTATTGGINWQISRFVVAPGQNYGTNPGYNNPCNEYQNYKPGSCQSVKTGNRDFPVNPINTTNLTGAGLGDSAGFLPYGSKVCYFLSVKPFDDSIAEWAHSAPSCSVVGKQPITAIQGNDLRVGSALAVAGNLSSIIYGSTLVKNGGTYGSWTEYGVTAPGTVSGVASGSAFAPAGGGASAQSQWSQLTFANTGSYGGYAPPASVGVLPDIGRYFQLSTVPSVTKKNVGDITLGAYEPNTVYISSGVVTIGGNLSAPGGTIPSISSLSQMVIIAAGGVRISQNVTNVDAWLIAPNGTIDTCYEQAGALTTNLCNKQLTVNGPVQAKSLKLRRTSGDEKTPAEAVNLRSDAYLWAHQVSAANGSWQTKYTTELPPRY